MAGEEKHGRHERDQVVERAEEEERAQGRGRRHVRLEHQHRRGLEDAQSARHAADQANHLGRDEDSDEMRKGDRPRRQQHIEDGGRGRPIHGPEDQLGDSITRGGQIEVPILPDQGLTDRGASDQIAQRAGHEQDAQGKGRVEKGMEGGGQRQRSDQEDRSTHQQEPDPKGHGAEHGYLGDVEGGDAEGGIDAVADQAPGHRAESHIVAEDITDEGGEGRDAEGQKLAREPQAQGIVTGQHQVAQGSQTQCEGDPAGGVGAEFGHDLRVAESTQLLMQGPESEREKDQGQGRAGPSQQVLHRIQVIYFFKVSR